MRILLLSLMCVMQLCYATDTHCKAVAIYKEANTESLRGKRAVLDVIEYRMKVLDKTACQVIQQPKQFSWYKRGGSLKATKKQLTAYNKVAKMPSVFNSAYYFHHKKVKWKYRHKFKKLGVITNHVFYGRKK